MSQTGRLQDDPQTAKFFVTDSGTAIPIENTIEFLGGEGIDTSGAGNVVTISGEDATAAPNPAAANKGIASFDDADFAVTNGFVTLIGGGGGLDSVQVDVNTPPGTNPVVGDIDGKIDILGGYIANHAKPVQTNSLAENQLLIQVQQTTSNASANADLNGIAHFDSSSFNVDSHGFVSLAAGFINVTSFGVDSTSGAGTNPVLPTVDGLVNINAATVLAGSVPAQTVSIAAHELQTQIQISQAIAAADATKVGLANFDSAYFSASSEGFVSASATGLAKTITGNSGGALSPSSHNWNIVGTGSITTSGAGSTLTAQMTGLTNHSILVGAGTSTITKVAPSATVGIPVVSAGVAADPIFGTAVVEGGGTGVTSFTAYAPVCGGTATTSPLQSATTGFETPGTVFTSNGNAALPSWQTPQFSLIDTQTASASASIIFSDLSVSITTFFVVCTNISAILADGSDLYMQVSYDNGTTWESTGYSSSVIYSHVGDATWANNGTITSAFHILTGIHSAFGSCSFYIDELPTPEDVKVYGQGFGNVSLQLPGGSFTATLDVNAIRFINITGDIATGTFSLYSVAR